MEAATRRCVCGVLDVGGPPRLITNADMKFTALERAVLDWMASHVDVANLAEQIGACQPTERELTGVGSYTKLAVPPDKARIDRPRSHSPIGGPWIDGTDGIHLGGIALLFLDETGYIKTLELVASGDHFDELATGFVLHAHTEPVASPNRGPAAPSGNSGATGGPPSVS
jgi:hypothetical protein